MFPIKQGDMQGWCPSNNCMKKQLVQKCREHGGVCHDIVSTQVNLHQIQGTLARSLSCGLSRAQPQSQNHISGTLLSEHVQCTQNHCVNVVVQVTMHRITIMSTTTYSSVSFGLFCSKTLICRGNNLPQLIMHNFPHENITPTTIHDISCHYALTVPSSCISLSVTSMTSSTESLTGLFVAMGSCGNDTSSK